MPFERKLPAVSNSANVKNSLSGTEKANSVAEKDLHFWLPLTKPLLKPGVTAVDTLQDMQFTKTQFLNPPPTYFRDPTKLYIKLW